MNLADILNPNIEIPGTPAPKWGYRYMSEEEYRNFPAINNSLLKCPTLAEMFLMLTTPSKQTDALALGTLADMAILTPDEPWKERFAVADIPINPQTGKAYGSDSQKAEKAMAEAAAANPGKFLASSDQFQKMAAELDGMARAFYAHHGCRAALQNCMKQVTGVLWHPHWQCWVKWKPDVLPLKADDNVGWCMRDLKTSARHPMDFERDCWQYGYFDQAGWYAHCHETLTASRGVPMKVSCFDFLVIGKEDLTDKRPRPHMARIIRVPLDPGLNSYMQSYQRRVFPEDGMGRVDMFLGALRQHIAANTTDPAELRKIWTAYEDEASPFILCKAPYNN